MTEQGTILACNAGSSSLKIEAFVGPPWRSAARGVVEGIAGAHATVTVTGDLQQTAARVEDYRAAAAVLLDRLRERDALRGRVIATGHRVVHGGSAFTGPVRVTPDVTRQLQQLAELAPLHNPAALAVMRALDTHLPGLPSVAVFDTAFFHDLPAQARTYAVPKAWGGPEGARRYGFHGIAHEYLYRRYAAGGGDRARVLTLQLGQGCSIAALRDGRPVETSMGYTPLEGLIMGTRAGDVDAGLVLHAMRGGQTLDAVDSALNHDSGLRALAGTADMRELLGREAAGDLDAAAAIAAFCHRIRKYLGAYAAVLGGVDAVLIGGGIGEHASTLRSRICEGLAWIGLELDEQANAHCEGRHAVISTPRSSIAVHVIPVREESAIARAVCATLGMADDGLGE